MRPRWDHLAVTLKLGTPKLGFLTAGTTPEVSLAIGAPFFVLFGWLSDKAGRLKIVPIGNVPGSLIFYPTYHAISASADPPNVPALIPLMFIQVLFSANVLWPMGRVSGRVLPAEIQIHLSFPGARRRDWRNWRRRFANSPVLSHIPREHLCRANMVEILAIAHYPRGGTLHSGKQGAEHLVQG